MTENSEKLSWKEKIAKAITIIAKEEGKTEQEIIDVICS